MGGNTIGSRKMCLQLSILGKIKAACAFLFVFWVSMVPLLYKGKTRAVPDLSQHNNLYGVSSKLLLSQSSAASFWYNCIYRLIKVEQRTIREPFTRLLVLISHFASFSFTVKVWYSRFVSFLTAKIHSVFFFSVFKIIASSNLVFLSSLTH